MRNGSCVLAPSNNAQWQYCCAEENTPNSLTFRYYPEINLKRVWVGVSQTDKAEWGHEPRPMKIIVSWNRISRCVDNYDNYIKYIGYIIQFVLLMKSRKYHVPDIESQTGIFLLKFFNFYLSYFLSYASKSLFFHCFTCIVITWRYYSVKRKDRIHVHIINSKKKKHTTQRRKYYNWVEMSLIISHFFSQLVNNMDCLSSPYF